MQDYYTTKLLELPEFLVENFENLQDKYLFCIAKRTTFELCPVCGHPTDRIHDKRRQKIKDIPIRGKPVILILSKRRFRCKICFNVFLETYESVEIYSRMTKRFKYYLYRQKNLPFKWVAESNFVSQQVAASNFYAIANKEISSRKPEIITALGIDENSFKKGSSYNVILTNIFKRRTVEVLPSRSRKYLDKFLADFPYKDLISFVVIDMYKPFLKSAKKHCPEAFVIIDKFHVLSHITRALGSVRKKKLYKKLGIRITRKMIMKPYSQLKDKEKEAMDFLLEDSPRFKQAYDFKERFSAFYHLDDIESAEAELLELTAIAMQSDISKLVDFGRLLMRWWQYILNYFICKLTNGFTEGINNKVKLIKKMSYGFRNRENFRLKILANCA